MFNIPTVPVVTRTLTAATSSVTLYYSSPGGTPRHLLVRTNVLATTGTPNFRIRLNGDSGSNYNIQVLDAAGSSATTLRETADHFGLPTNVTSDANEFCSGSFLFPDALSTRTDKSVLAMSGRVEDFVRIGAGRWANTAAITSVTLYLDASTFTAGSTFELCVVDEAYNVSETILTGDSGSAGFAITGISGADGDLVCIGNLRSDRGGNADSIRTRFNGDTTDTNYYTQRFIGYASTTAAESQNLSQNAACTASTAEANNFGAYLCQIINFADGSNDRISNCLHGFHEGTAPRSQVGFDTTRWDNTAAVTAVQLWCNDYDFVANSMLSIYAVPKNLITRTELASAAATVTFADIPQTYDHLELVVYGRSDEASTAETVYVDMNADTTTANYDRQLLVGTGTTVTAAQSAANRSCGRVPGDNATANVFGGGATTIYNYTKTDRHKHRLTTNGTTGGYESAQLESTRWENTSAVTSLTVRLNDDSDFMAGSVFTLRGISATPSSSDAANINSVVIGSIAAINSIAIASIQAMNNVALATAGGGGTSYAGITWSTDDTLPVNQGFGIKMGIVGANAIVNCNDPGASGFKVTYEHDGSSWSTGGSCATTHGVGAGGGTQTAGVIFNGYGGSDESNVTEEYNGSSWSTGNNTVQGSAYMTGGGVIQTAQLATGGSSYNPTVRDLSMTQTYNGTNWANESVASSGQGGGTAGESAGGGLDAFLIAGGALDSPGTQSAAQIFNQTAGTWTSKAGMSVAARYTASATDGTRVYKVGGYDASAPHASDIVESWVENSWSTENALPAVKVAAGCGSGGLEATGGATAIGGNSDTATTNSYYIAAAS